MKSVSYGDLVYIEISDLLPPPSTDTRLLCSTGFLEETIYGVKTQDYKKASFRNCVFTVRPSLVDANEDLHALNSLRTELSFLSLSKPDTLGEKCLTQEINYKEKQIELNKENLQALNKKILLEMNGKPMHYGDMIILEHMESGYYLCADSLYHPNNPTLYNLKLQKSITPACYFKFFSYLSTSDRGLIDYEGEMKLVSAHLNTVVTMGEIKNELDSIGLNPEDSEKEEEPAKPLFPTDEIRRSDVLSSFTMIPLAVGMALESNDNNKIKLIKYCSRDDLIAYDKRKIIKNGDYVRFQIEDFYLTVSNTKHRQNFDLVEQQTEGYPYNFINSIFQIVKLNQENQYPKGSEIQSVPKKFDEESDEIGKFYVKHLMSGNYLSVPKEKIFKSTDANSEDTELAEKTPFFHFINSHLHQKGSLTRNARVSLKAFQGNIAVGQFYLESEVEKYQVLQADMNTKYFIGFKNADDKIKSKLKRIRKNIVDNKSVGSFFKISPVQIDERKKILEIESYSRAIERFIRVLQSYMAQEGKITPAIFEAELAKILKCSKELGLLTEVNDFQTQIMVREFKILDKIAKLFSYFCLNPAITNIFESKRFELKDIIALLQNFSGIVLNTTKHIELSTIYISQYVRLFLLCLLDPCPLYQYCDKDQIESLKDIVMAVLHRTLGEKDLCTFGQFNFYEIKLFASLDAQKDYCMHLLKTMNHFFRNKAPNLQNTLRENFIKKYVSDPERVKNIFPKITASPEGEQDFIIQFERDGYPEQMPLSSAPSEVLKYLVWVFKVIAATAQAESLKFSSIVISYYTQDLCEAMLNSPKVSPKLKISILEVVRVVHSAYDQLPFDALPPKIQMLLSPHQLDAWSETFQKKIEEAQQTLVSADENSIIKLASKTSSGSVDMVDIGDLSLELLKGGFEEMQNGDLKSLEFILQVMKNLLNQEDLNDESLCTIHHCLGMLIHNLAEELSTKNKGIYSEVCLKNIDKIFNLFLKVDKCVGKRAFKEAVWQIKDKMLKHHIKEEEHSDKPQLTWEDEGNVIRHMLDGMLVGWKSKEKLYLLNDDKTFSAKYLEEELMKDLWKIVGSEEQELTYAIIELIKEKTLLEANIRKQLFDCAILAENGEIENFDQLVTSLLTLNRIQRRIKLKTEFDLTNKEDEQALNEIIQNLESIFLIIYDYEAHLADEDKGMFTETPKETFLQRFKQTKAQGKNELPFKYKSFCIKTVYQKILNVLQAHKIIVPFIHHLVYSKVFEGVSGEQLKYGNCLCMVIMIVFMYKNTLNQNIMSKYTDFILTFYSEEIEKSSIESIFMFIEMIRDNKKLLKLDEDYLFSITACTFIEFYSNFKSNSQDPIAINYIRALPVIYTCQIPKDMFNPAQFMMNTFFDLSDTLRNDDKLSLFKLISQNSSPAILEGSTREEFSRTVTGFSDISEIKANHLDMPISYSILKELLEAQRKFALTEDKERVLTIQSSFTLERVLPFLKNENLEFNFELKRLTLQTLENAFLNNLYRNTNIFLDYDHFMSFISTLLIDVYGYLRCKLENHEEDEIFEIFKSDYFSKEVDLELIKRYDNLIDSGVDNIFFLQYQSLGTLKKIWKKYINYILCDFFGHILYNFKDYVLTVKNKEQKYNNVFEIWFKLVLKLRSMDTELASRTELDNALKNAVIHSEYAHRRELVYITLERTLRRQDTVVGEMADQDTSLGDHVENFLSIWFGDKKEFKISIAEGNLTKIVSILGFDKLVLTKLVETLFVTETPLKDRLLILAILRKLIEAENQTEANKNLPIYLWGDVSETEFANIHNIQNELIELGVVKAIFALLYDLQGHKAAVYEILLLCISLLYGGNQTVQDTFYLEFKEDFDNEILSNFLQILEETLELLRVRERKKTQESYTKALQYTFNYLLNKPKSSTLVTNGAISVPEELREKLITGYHSDVLNKLSDKTPEYDLLLIIFEFLQTLCEGHYLNFQDFLREQTLVDQSKSINIPQFLINAYHLYFKHINSTNTEIGIKILDLLIELQQGESRANSEVLLQKTFLSDLCTTLTGFSTHLDLLSRGFSLEPGLSSFTTLKSKVLTLLKDLVERSEPHQLQQISQFINLKALASTFKENVVAYNSRKGFPRKEALTPEEIWDPNLSNAFTVYFILKHLSRDEPANNFTPEIETAFKEILEDGQAATLKLVNKYLNRFFNQYTGSVEIYYKSLDRLMKIYFPISVVYSYIKPETKSEFENSVDRSSSQAKIADFMDSATELIGQSVVEYNSRERLLGLNFYNTYNWLRFFTNVFALLVMLFDLLHLEYTEEKEVVYKAAGDMRVQYLLCCSQSFLGAFLVFLWMQTRLRRNLAIKWDEFVSENVKEKGQLSPDIVKKLNEGKITEAVGKAVLLYKGPYSEEWAKVEKLMASKRTQYDIYFTFRCTTFLWHLAYLAICIASNFHPLFASFQLFDIVIRSDTVSRIALSVSRNIGQFMWTLILLVVTVYVYSIIGMYFFHDRFVSEEGDMCIDAFSCYLGSLNHGLRSGGGISDVLQKVAYVSEEKGTYLLHTLFDMSFFILIITLLLNLIFGMIIDAFGDLRDEKSNNDEDMKNVCFICGLTRTEYERTSDFEVHVSEEHNMWQYLAYLNYLIEKSKSFATELTDIEDYVLDRYRKRDHIWIPIGRSLTLEQVYAKEQKGQKSEIEELKEELAGNIAEVRDINKEILTRLNERSNDSIISRSPKNSVSLLQPPLSNNFFSLRTKNF